MTIRPVRKLRNALNSGISCHLTSYLYFYFPERDKYGEVTFFQKCSSFYDEICSKLQFSLRKLKTSRSATYPSKMCKNIQAAKKNRNIPKT